LTVVDDERMIGEVTRIGVLYDFYAPLLTERQRRMVELHYLEDLSLGEIADNFGVSRQAVHDNLRRAKDQMDGYEETLHLAASQALFTERLLRVVTAWREIRESLSPECRLKMDEALCDWVKEEGLLTGRDTHA
jgi:uncharacterized protein